MPKHQTAKVKARIPGLLKDIMEGKTQDEMAQKYGVSRRAINLNIVSPEFQSILGKTMNEMLNDHFRGINMLLGSDDPQDRREGLREMGRMVRALLPKWRFERSESLDTDMVIEGMQKMIAAMPYDGKVEWLKRFEEGEDAEYSLLPENKDGKSEIA